MKASRSTHWYNPAACFVALGIVAITHSSCTIVGSRSVNWSGLYVGSGELPLGAGMKTVETMTSLGYTPRKGGPDFLVVLPDGSKIDPDHYSLSKMLAWFQRAGAIEEPPAADDTAITRFTYFLKDGEAIGRMQTHHYDSDTKVNNDVIISLYYDKGETSIHFDKSKAGRLSHLRMRSLSGKNRDRIVPAIVDPKTGDVLKLPIQLNEMKQHFGEPDRDDSGLWST